MPIDRLILIDRLIDRKIYRQIENQMMNNGQIDKYKDNHSFITTCLEVQEAAKARTACTAI